MGRRSQNLLTQLQVKNLKAPGRYADGGGLYLVVDEAGLKRWMLRYQIGGRRRDMGLGSAADVGLAEARQARTDAQAQLRAGKDPIEERKRAQVVPEERAAQTFGDLAEEVITEKEKGFKNPARQGKKWRQDMRLHCKPIWAKPVEAIDTEDVLRVLRPIWATKSDTASRIRGRIEDVLDAARAKGQRTTENPARWKGHLSHLLGKRQRLTHGHRPAMPYQDLPAFMERLAAKGGNGALALRWTILTVVRENEALGALIGEIELEAKVWTIPGGRGGRMKGSNPPDLRVPLSDAAVEILQERLVFGDEPGKLLFPGAKPGRPLSNSTMDRVLEDLGAGAFTVHGFRSSFKDWATDLTPFPDSLSEEALAHKVGDDVRQAYRRSDALEKRRLLMQAWADYLTKPRGQVLPLGRPAGARVR